jgi:NAD(P)-dependent dehydrogenase (short-subunit alcohol dehydrogenase family)
MSVERASPGTIARMSAGRNAKKLSGKIALVAGATRGAGRGIAIALGEAGATVYSTGRSSRGHPATPGRPETIDETAELVTAAGGRGIPVRVDHTIPGEVKKLVALIKRHHQGLDILVNDVWGGDALTEFGKPFWTVNLNNGLQMLKQAIHSHIITSHYAVPLMLARGQKGRGRGGIIFEITDGDAFYYRGNIFYDLVKISVIRLAFAMAHELRKRDITSVALTPGFLRSEAVLDHFGVTEANWKEVGKKNTPNASNQNDSSQDFMVSESPRYIGRAVVALAADPKVKEKSGRVFSSWALAHEYGFTDLDGTQPHWGNHARKKYGKYKTCDEQFYSYWAPGLIDLIFPDWFSP